MSISPPPPRRATCSWRKSRKNGMPDEIFVEAFGFPSAPPAEHQRTNSNTWMRVYAPLLLEGHPNSMHRRDSRQQSTSLPPSHACPGSPTLPYRRRILRYTHPHSPPLALLHVPHRSSPCVLPLPRHRVLSDRLSCRPSLRPQSYDDVCRAPIRSSPAKTVAPRHVLEVAKRQTGRP